MSEHKMIPPNTLLAFGVVGGLAGIYLAYFLRDMNSIFVFFAALGAVCAAVWGADVVRRVASYGLGTGVPSIGMLALGMGIIAVLFGLSLGLGAAGPIVAFIISCVIGAIIGIISVKVVGMTIPIMVSATTEIAGLALSAEKAGIAVVLSGFASVAGMGAIVVTVLIGIFIWYIFFGKYYALVKRDAYKVVDTGMLPTEEEMA